MASSRCWKATLGLAGCSLGLFADIDLLLSVYINMLQIIGKINLFTRRILEYKWHFTKQNQHCYWLIIHIHKDKTKCMHSQMQVDMHICTHAALPHKHVCMPVHIGTHMPVCVRSDTHIPRHMSTYMNHEASSIAIDAARASGSGPVTCCREHLSVA